MDQKVRGQKLLGDEFPKILLNKKNQNGAILDSKKNKIKYLAHSNGAHYPHYSTNYSPEWKVFNEVLPVRKGSYNQVSPKPSYQTQSLYVKNINKTNLAKGYSSDKNVRTSHLVTSSESESALAGFKIVQNGKIIYNEIIQEDGSSTTHKQSFNRHPSKSRFASSEMMTGPSAKEISIPIFVESN